MQNMTEEVRQTMPRPILTSISAQLFVADIQASCDFYTGKLGFAVDFVYGDPPFYGQVTREQRTAFLAPRRRARLRWRCSRTRRLALRLDHRRQRRRDQTALSELSGSGRNLPSNAQAGTLGGHSLRRRRSRWKSGPLRWPGWVSQPLHHRHPDPEVVEAGVPAYRTCNGLQLQPQA